MWFEDCSAINTSKIGHLKKSYFTFDAKQLFLCGSGSEEILHLCSKPKTPILEMLKTCERKILDFYNQLFGIWLCYWAIPYRRARHCTYPLWASPHEPTFTFTRHMIMCIESVWYARGARSTTSTVHCTLHC